MLKIRARIFYLIFITGMVGLSCDRDSGTNPKPKNIGYNVYSLIWGLPDNPMSTMIYNTAQKCIIDTIFLSPAYYNGSSRIAVTSDEHILVFSSRKDDGTGLTQLYDLWHHKVISEYPWGGDVAISSDGQTLAIAYWNLHIINLRTRIVTYEDSTDTWGCVFDQSDSLLLAIQPGGSIFRYNIRTKQVLPVIHVQGGTTPRIDQVILTQKTDKLFLHFQISSNMSRVASYYTSKDSIQVIGETHGAGGEIKLTPDGKTLIFTDPASMFGNFGTRSIYFADAVTDRVTTTLPPSDEVTGNDSLWLNPQRIAITSDGKLAVFNSADFWTQTVVSLDTRSYVEFFPQSKSNEDYSYAIDISIPEL